MITPNSLIEAIIAKATLSLKANQNENGGIVDYEIFQNDLSCLLEDVEHLQQENEELIKALRETVAEKNDALEQKKAVSNMYDNQSRLMENNFTGWSLS